LRTLRVKTFFNSEKRENSSQKIEEKLLKSRFETFLQSHFH
jgi:hypothetical protein